jgi:SAM-dependent methyltransferase
MIHSVRDLIIRDLIKPRGITDRFLASLGSHSRVLDLGCGSGIRSSLLKQIHPNSEIYGVDRIERERVPHFVIYKKVDLDVEPLPYPDGFFDAIIFNHVIEHLKQPLQLGSEINRVLKRDGKIYVETPNWTTIFVPSFGFKREQLDSPFNFYDDPTHVKPWSKQGIFAFLAQNCELQVEKVGTVRNWARVPFDPLEILRACAKGERRHVVGSVWNLYGWCIYGIARKA